MVMLSVVVLTFNSDSALLARCLQSVDVAAAQVETDVQLIVIDNASTRPPELPVLSNVKVLALQNAGNEGFGRAMNRAVREAGGDLILLFNPDAEMEPTALAELLKATRRHPERTFFGGWLVNAGSLQVDAYWIWHTSVQHYFGRKRQLRRLLDSQARDEIKCAKLCGAALAGRRDELLSFGPFDDDYFLYGEDADLSIRARSAGYDLVLLPRMRVAHQAATSARTYSRLVEQARVDGMLRMQRKHLPVIVHPLTWLELALVTGVGLLYGGRSSHSRRGRFSRFNELLRWGPIGMAARFQPPPGPGRTTP